MEYVCRIKGVCAMQVTFDMDENKIVRNIRFLGGCNGNTQGVAALAEGRKAEELISLLSGINCGGKGTSCPDQLSKALAAAIKDSEEA